jgi:hypothetical protein
MYQGCDGLQQGSTTPDFAKTAADKIASGGTTSAVITIAVLDAVKAELSNDFPKLVPY